MTRIFGLAVGALWLVFTYMAFSAGSAGRQAGQPDVAFWYTATALLLGLAALVAIVGTLRHRPSGPRK